MAASELKKRTIDSLRRYNSLRAAKESLMLKLTEYDVHINPENMTGRMREQLDSLNRNFTMVVLELESTETALSTLDYSDRHLLEKFYINRTPNYIRELCEYFSLETAQIYRLKEKALERYCMAKNGKSLKEK